MTIDQIMSAVNGALKDSLADLPSNYLGEEPEEAYELLAARLAIALSKRGILLASREEFKSMTDMLQKLDEVHTSLKISRAD